MKFTLNWLKDYLDTNASLAEVCDTLTAIGLEVESVTDMSASLKDFVVAEIVEANQHPNADKLRVCKVNDGTETRQIVCGAANARGGIKVVLAREGVFIPGSGITIKKTKIRDVESNGMLCSAEELKLADASEGIIELPLDAKPGSPAAPALGADDPMIEINITPNRQDCLGVYGIARDLAAAGLGKLKPLSLPEHKGSFASPVSVKLETPNCPLFIGAYIKGVKNPESPAWMKARLSAIGLRPISALVDITNYITFSYGRPLHVFDAKKVSGNLTVREAIAGEELKALNGKEYTLTSGMTVIADDKKAEAIGGIIGGEETGCTETTTEVILEAAYFEPVNIATTGRKLEVLSDARYRFERGVDPEFVKPGALLALQLIKEICGGEASELFSAGKAPEWKREVTFRPSRVKSLGGVDVPEAECERILTTLGFGLSKKGDAWSITPPSWRRDVEGESDIVEEVLRVHGYKHIPVTPLPKPVSISKPALNAPQKRAHLAKRTLASRGMMEVVSWSFLPQAQAEMFGGGAEALKLVNPISAELDAMRPSLIPNLLTAAKNNANRGISTLSLFEVGVQFKGIAPNEQATAATGIRIGAKSDVKYAPGNMKLEEREPDVFDAKADLFALLAALGLNPESASVAQEAPEWYHPGRSGTVALGKNVLGYFGELHPGIAKIFDLDAKQRVAMFELNLDALPQPRAKGKAKPKLELSAYQPVERDFAFVVDMNVAAAQITKSIASAEKNLIRDVQIFDVFSGEKMEAGKKSVAVKVVLQAPDRTLTEAEIGTVTTAIVDAATKGFGGKLRA